MSLWGTRSTDSAFGLDTNLITVVPATSSFSFTARGCMLDSCFCIVAAVLGMAGCQC